ncbi:MAG: hypothetical protein H8K07_01675 [Nitrospira sp.]|nr:hypothetical protein [Nitrospira sp.]
MRCRWRCASKIEQYGGQWVIVLHRVFPRRLPLDAIPTGQRPTGRLEIMPRAPFEFATWDPKPWQVGKIYQMTINRTKKETHP